MDLSADGWNARYVQGRTPWELGTVAPPFVWALRERRVRPGRLAIPGCGCCHELLYFARHGFEVTGFDIAPEACRKAEEMVAAAGLRVQIVCGDFFALDARYDAAFDAVLEQTFYCAIDPRFRPKYVETVRRILRPHGKLFGLFFAIDDTDGPPFGTDSDELRHTFEPAFRIDHLAISPYSHPRRQGEELWAEFVRLP